MHMLTNAERKLLRQLIRKSFALLPRLQGYSVEVHQPCTYCGCLLFARVSGGYRCLHCWPPLDVPRALRHKIEALRMGANTNENEG